MSKPVFTHTQDQFKQITEDMLQIARDKGATDAAVEVSEGGGLSISVRKGKVETIEQNRDKGIGITVYIGQKRGNASTSDFSRRSLEDTVAAAYNIARFTAEDDCAGLPDADALEMKLLHPWLITAEEAIALASRTEAAAFAVDKRISNCDGAGVHAQQSHFVAANTRGFSGGYAFSRHTISVAPIAGKGAHMQRDDWYSSHRDPKKLAAPEAVGHYAAERALARLHARTIDTRKCPVLFEAPLAAGLLGAFVQAVSGGALYRKSTFLLDTLGTQIFPTHIQVKEDPHVIGAVGSSPFDDEGVKTQKRDVVSDG
ncbi:MAG: metalloprotease PmbA, partial [Burkholderiales bacterium]|nr:metalloprotease PmbA [Burkholderiales bacterium]